MGDIKKDENMDSTPAPNEGSLESSREKNKKLVNQLLEKIKELLTSKQEKDQAIAEHLVEVLGIMIHAEEERSNLAFGKLREVQEFYRSFSRDLGIAAEEVAEDLSKSGVQLFVEKAAELIKRIPDFNNSIIKLTNNGLLNSYATEDAKINVVMEAMKKRFKRSGS